MSEHVLAILVKAIGAEKAAKNLKGIDAAVSSIGAKAGKGLRTAGDNLGRLGLIAGGVAAAGIVASVKAAADFESQLNTINTVAGLTQDQLTAVGGGIRKLARDTGSDLTDLTSAYYDLVSAGIKPGADALKVLTLANTLAIGGLGTTAETVDLLTTAINTYHLNAAQAAKATDQFAEAIALGKVTASQLAESFAIVGPIAQKAGVGINQIAAGYATLTAKGVPAAEAATEMRSAIVALMKPTSSLTTAGHKLGIDFLKVAKTQGLQVALQKIADYSAKTGIPLSKLMGRIEGVQYLLATTGTSAAQYKDALAKVNGATGTAADQMSERQKGLNYQLGRLKALARDAGITLGSKLLPKLTPLVEKAVAFLDTHQSDIDKFGDGIAKAFDKALSFAERIPWGAIGDGLQMAADWAGKLMDAFTSLPPGAQATIIALAGLNKLSGGAITGITGEIGKGLIKGVLGLNAGVVNIKAGVVNGGGGSGIPSGAGGAAGAAGATGGLAPMGIGALLGTAAIGGAIGIVAASVEKGITDALAGPIHDLTGLSTSRINAGADQSRSQAFGGIAAIADLPGTINKMTDAVGQLGSFINSPHPDFLGDLGNLAMVNYHGPAAGPTHAGPVSNGALGEHAAAEAVVPAIDRMKTRLAGLLQQGRRAQDAGETGRANRLHSKIVDLKVQIKSSEQATARAIADTKRATDAAKAAVDAAKAAQVSQIRSTGSTTVGYIRGTTGAVNTAQGAIVAALARVTPVVNVSTLVTVGPGTVTHAVATQSRVGSVGGSRSRRGNGGAATPT